MSFVNNKISKSSLKICLVSSTLPPLRCGVGDYTLKLAQALSVINKVKVDLSILTSSRLPSPVNTSEEDFKLINIVNKWNWVNLWKILAYFKHTEFDIVHFQYPTMLYGRHPAITLLPLFVRLISILKGRFSVVCVLTVHEYNSFRFLGKFRIWLMALFCQRIIAVTGETENSLHLLRLLGKKIELIPIGNSINTDLPSDYVDNPEQWRKNHNLQSGVPVIAYFGYISPSKGLPTLIEAFAGLDINAQLLMIADQQAQDEAYQAYMDRINQLIEDKKLGQKIAWTGFATEAEVAAYFREATMVVLPFVGGASIRRSSLIAALSNGAPVISTYSDNHVQDEGLLSEENILLVEAENPASLSLAIEKLIENDTLRRKLSINGLNFARKLGWPEIAAKHLALYLNQEYFSE